ncbi:hypothetical protein NECAME_13147 [Necator americanus]|uniref:Uncharacterized protein n=1 Tax=Necator americanus TaxID=51031 RepID=W2SWP5_NECAM|nr:hypothetical protein NECAME_13147 [Necator americanus]ETN74184.1 hypothetical protein NECAME_13147 [Necator americanus]
MILLNVDNLGNPAEVTSQLKRITRHSNSANPAYSSREYLWSAMKDSSTTSVAYNTASVMNQLNTEQTRRISS